MLYLFVLLFTLSSCELEELSVEEKVNYTTGSLNEANLNSLLTFEGVETVSNVTDTTVSLHWSELEGAVTYLIYDISSGSPVLIQSIPAPSDSVYLDNLLSDYNYKFMVRVRDSEGQIDTNEKVISATTLEKPSEVDYVLLSNPISKNDIIKTPSFYILGVNPGDVISLYTDDCSTEVAKGKAVTTFIELTVEEELTEGVDYTFKADRKSVNNLTSDCSTVFASYSLLKCPTGYEYVPKDTYLSVDEFCVMKYEAKAWSDADNDNIVDSSEVDADGCNEAYCTTANWGLSGYKPGSSPYGLPWVLLDFESAQSECQSLGEGYDLISNLEWMSLAYLIEKNSENWTDEAVGSGSLLQGNNGVDGDSSYNGHWIDGGASRSLKAAFVFENGEVSPAEVWDLSGNANEWVNWQVSTDYTFMPYDCTDDWINFSEEFCLGEISSELYMPRNPANILSSLYFTSSSYGLGFIEGGRGKALTRGGDFRSKDYAGLYTASFSLPAKTTSKYLGFRCVYRP